MSKGLILIVDDVEDTRQLLGELLRFAGYEVALAASGAEALEQTRKAVPHLVITDFMMPGMNGLELAQRLRGEPRSAGVPILLVTAVGSEGLARLGGVSPKPFVRIVPKPFDPDTLVQLIDDTLAA